MGVYKGSISNYSLPRRSVAIFMGLVLPPFMIAATFTLAIVFKWWPIMLVPDLIVFIIALSIWGTILKGHILDFTEKTIRYQKGFQNGTTDYSDIIKVYHVSLKGRSSILIIFRDRSSSRSPPRCFCVEQTFSEEDKIRIRDELLKRREKGGYDIIDNAPLNLINKEKSQIGWVHF